MAKYITKQRRVLLEFLNGHSDEVLSAKQIFENVKQYGISESAVYRNLSSLLKDGEIKKVSRAESETLYRFVGTHADCKSALHLSCKKCGKMFHLSDTTTNALLKSLESADNFNLDKSDTVLYGVCNKCR